jgi:glycerol-3-phosphate dehydrogenase
MLEHAALQNPTVTLDDLRRDVRLGMGPCQGGFCTYRAVGILHELGQRAATQAKTAAAGEQSGAEWEVAYMQSPSHNAGQEKRPVERSVERSAEAPSAILSGPTAEADLLLHDFLQERWRGLTPILWGQQLKQERLDELIYLSVLNADHLPDSGARSPLSDFWQFDTTPQ